MNCKNLHIYPSNFKHETRILKETKSLITSDLMDKIFIAALWEKGLREHEQIDDRREVWRAPLKSQSFPTGSLWKILKFLEWYLKIFFKFKKENIEFINCHSLSTLPLGVLFKSFLKSRLVYDTHELETEVIGSKGLRRRAGKVFEKLLIPYADIIIVVSDSIAKWYKDQYNLKEVSVVRNVPYRLMDNNKSTNILKKKFRMQDDEILFIFQGSFSEHRGINMLLSAFSKVDKKKHVVFMGYGMLENSIKEYEQNYSNIHYYPAIKPEDIIMYTKSADVGISITENTCLSHFYSLPNKVFEYLMSGIPLIVSDFPEMGKIIDENNCGWKVSVNEKSVFDLIDSITIEELNEKRNSVLRCKDFFGWDKEEEKLLKAYLSFQKNTFTKASSS